jgi:hypothetical protein
MATEQKLTATTARQPDLPMISLPVTPQIELGGVGKTELPNRNNVEDTMLSPSQIYADILDLVAKLASDDTIQMSTPPDPLPTEVEMWRIFITENNDEIDIGFDKVARHTLKTNETIDQYLATILPGGPAWKNPSPTLKAERETGPLSIQKNDYSYVVIFLRNENLEFSKNMTPFQVKSDKSAFYSGARCIWKDGASAYSGEKPNPDVAVPCRVAYFIADSKADQHRFGKPVGMERVFTTHFNLYLDIVSTTTKRRTPIVIDPDVGHPGGNE